MGEHMHIDKSIFVHGIFQDWQQWSQGIALLARSDFVRLGDPSQPGRPQNVVLYRPASYEGNRDTEPRFAVVGRVREPPWYPFIVGVHFTTLVGERTKRGGEQLSKGEARRLRDRAEAAELLRFQQAKRVLRLLQEHVLGREELVLLVGDFNAGPGEACIFSVLETEGGFLRLAPSNPVATHYLKASEPSDHIFLYPQEKVSDYTCWIVASELAREASDHFPVVAEVTMDESQGDATA